MTSQAEVMKSFGAPPWLSRWNCWKKRASGVSVHSGWSVTLRQWGSVNSRKHEVRGARGAFWLSSWTNSQTLFEVIYSDFLFLGWFKPFCHSDTVAKISHCCLPGLHLKLLWKQSNIQGIVSLHATELPWFYLYLTVSLLWCLNGCCQGDIERWKLALKRPMEAIMCFGYFGFKSWPSLYLLP